MDWSTVESRWNDYKNNVKLRWSRIPDEHIDQMQGRRESLSQRVQEAYALSREEAERQIVAWLAKQTDKSGTAA
jgi:uncharacterized protein YjbJ (UPF0337 family)